MDNDLIELLICIREIPLFIDRIFWKCNLLLRYIHTIIEYGDELEQLK